MLQDYSHIACIIATLLCDADNWSELKMVALKVFLLALLIGGVLSSPVPR